MTSKRALFWTILVLTLSLPALAHDTWLLARPSAVEPGKLVVAVGTPKRPPHRSRRAVFPHRALR